MFSWFIPGSLSFDVVEQMYTDDTIIPEEIVEHIWSIRIARVETRIPGAGKRIHGIQVTCRVYLPPLRFIRAQRYMALVNRGNRTKATTMSSVNQGLLKLGLKICKQEGRDRAYYWVEKAITTKTR